MSRISAKGARSENKLSFLRIFIMVLNKWETEYV
jgi:hypothetical protein